MPSEPYKDQEETADKLPAVDNGSPDRTPTGPESAQESSTPDYETGIIETEARPEDEEAGEEDIDDEPEDEPKKSFWQSFTDFFLEVGSMVQFAGSAIRHLFIPPFENRELVRQAYLVGNNSIGLIAITGFIMGFVLTIQTRPVLVDFGAQSMVPGMIAISMIREIGPVITALLAAGKISSGFGAEIGAMTVTEQIDAMEVSGTKPMNYVVATRIMATTLMIPILVFFADALGLFGSFIAVNLKEPMSFSLYLNKAFSALSFSDIIPATIKSVFFGFFIGLIGCYKGYKASRGTEAVGRAANSAVVEASLTIFIIDMLAAQITELFVGF